MTGTQSVLMPSDVAAMAMAAAYGLFLVNRISYDRIKRSILSRRRWCLNICCGHTDGGGINVDIVRHSAVRNFKRVRDIYRLPFRDRKFEWVLCSHTVEHVDDPERLDRELRRVGRNVLYVVPPLWDLAAAFNVFEHKWLFLTLSKEHRELPRYIKLPFARTIQRAMGQRISA
ncbi:MAG: methyltransferase domain-containing protein [Candidatus Eisenbacteria bacterium]|nr:methyltransferase domain-containing protein [Candidatus Eisenbacteria bacterium]